ncbi:sodium:solute symporter family protein [Microbulbifer spongiae]|uniref:Na+:solute symporter n=1 Tax=Microbulbifer spongiae TaxID=2944933 RepID=A0ABY9EEB3_9GAMM|nr:sodium:solute symporter family protein [Microbulbifer sp. MI-G]WKD49879.1 Na+:solute symporter [Microbulbifer sp. MI-G]
MQQSVLSGIDWLVILLLLGFSLGIGLLVRDRAGAGGLEGFFVAGRRMRWWFLGTSIVATTFASDTPLAITGWIAQYGIAGNWFWWGGAAGSIAITVFFARIWRSSGVVTDAEIAELRYGGKQAAALRTVKAGVNATFVNCVILGWVFAGMGKISEPFMDWQALLGTGLYSAFANLYPEALLFHSIDNTITILLLLFVTLFYTTLGGLRAVMVTDLVQFVLAMGMSILIAFLAVDHLGGLEAMWSGLAERYPADSGDAGFLPAQRIASFAPAFGEGVVGALGIPFSAFVLTLGVMWWTSGQVDGSGYISQRLYSAEDGDQAEKGALWYAFANFLLRSWPWAIAGVAALVIYPRVEIGQLAEEFTACAADNSQCNVQMEQCITDRYRCDIPGYTLLTTYTERVAQAGGETVQHTVYQEDRERGYPALMRDLLPAGLLGLALASLMAAFMSTVSTHINWGASYIANDFYKRLLDPSASDRRLTWVSRFATLGIAGLSAWVATFVENIGAMWELWGGMMAGLGLPHLMRWFWWRANAWTEISGMLTGLILACWNFLAGRGGGFAADQMSILPGWMASHPIHVICWISLAAALVSVITTLLTPPVEAARIRAFAARVKPLGFWRGYNVGQQQPVRGFWLSALCWLLGTASLYAGMFGVGYLLRLEPATGVALLLACALLLWATLRGLSLIGTDRAGLQRTKGDAALLQ